MLRFDAKALYAALDAQRQDRGLSWEALASDIGVAAATMKRARLGGRMEVDGVLAMCAWLNQPVEAFTLRMMH